MDDADHRLRLLADARSSARSARYGRRLACDGGGHRADGRGRRDRRGAGAARGAGVGTMAALLVDALQLLDEAGFVARARLLDD
ncbi:MAG: hypothetical protein MZW92_58545 [Comamonadaceae bacterium]|nr:hypothetical protein [Comamonadaceae bacterium]